jgi:hypothetical protein
MKRPVEQESKNHSCCGEAPPETPPESSLGSSGCECGREAPPSVAAESMTTFDSVSSPTSTEGVLNQVTAFGMELSSASRPPAPPPAPPAYLIDCAFLT